MSETEFVLAIDIGGSHIVVATARLTQSEHAEIALHEWGESKQRAPAIAYLAHDDTLLFGDDAAQRAAEEPARAVANFTHRLGDDIPLAVDGCELPAELLYARAVSWVIDTVSDAEGAAPAALTLTHPAHWGEHRLMTLRDALHRQGITEITTIPAAKAVAMHLDATNPLESGETVGVYDMGAETVTSVVLCKRHDGLFDIVGDAIHIDSIGGTGFEDAVLAHVIAAASLDIASLAPHSDASHLRDAVREAKEALSSHPDATITIPVAETSVRITRAEFENMIVDDIDQSLEALTQAIDSAHLTPGALSAIVLAGGSSRIPFIAQRMSDRFNRPIIVGDALPEAAAVLGAARADLAGLRAKQLSENGADGELDESTDAAPSFSPVLVGASQAPSSALRRRGPFIVFSIAATVMAGAIVLGGAAALGDTRVDPSDGATRPSDTTRSEIRPTPSPSDTFDDETAPDENAAPAPTPEPGSRSPGAIRPPAANQQPERSSLISHQQPSDSTSPVTARPPIESTPKPTAANTSTPPPPAGPQPADPPPPAAEPTTSPAEPTTSPADPAPAPDPNPEPAPVADPPPASDPTPTEPAPQNPVQEQLPGVDTD